jgi:sulfate transport system ATP-binding protein/LacI family transcriptional regulator/LacI family repressor for deo operon, udp, cdd, tsx, nupC, and nupG
MSVKEIAKKAQTSTATVSRVLNDPEYRCRSKELQQKIWDIAQEMNYIPNEAAVALKKGGTAGKQKEYYVHVLITRSGDSETDPFFEEVLRLLTSELLKNSCVLSNVWRMPNLTNDSTAAAQQIAGDVDKVLAQSEGKRDALIFLGKSRDNVYKTMSEVQGRGVHTAEPSQLSCGRGFGKRRAHRAPGRGVPVFPWAPEHRLCRGYPDGFVL